MNGKSQVNNEKYWTKYHARTLTSSMRSLTKNWDSMVDLLSRSSYFSPLTNSMAVGLGGLGVTFSPRDPRFGDSNPTEVNGFFQDVKILSTSPSGGTLSWGSRV